MLEMPSCTLIDLSVARVDAVAVEDDPLRIVLAITTTPPTAVCPVCGKEAHRVHSRSCRALGGCKISWVFRISRARHAEVAFAILRRCAHMFRMRPQGGGCWQRLRQT